MESMRESWTDKHLDDLNDKVDGVGADVRAHGIETRTEFAAVRGEMRDGFDRVDDRFQRVDDRFQRMEARLDDRFDALHRLLIQIAALTITALLGVLTTQL
jgi:hypothetical protein